MTFDLEIQNYTLISAEYQTRSARCLFRAKKTANKTSFQVSIFTHHFDTYTVYFKTIRVFLFKYMI